MHDSLRLPDRVSSAYGDANRHVHLPCSVHLLPVFAHVQGRVPGGSLRPNSGCCCLQTSSHQKSSKKSNITAKKNSKEESQTPTPSSKEITPKTNRGIAQFFSPQTATQSKSATKESVSKLCKTPPALNGKITSRKEDVATPKTKNPKESGKTPQIKKPASPSGGNLLNYFSKSSPSTPSGPSASNHNHEDFNIVNSKSLCNGKSPTHKKKTRNSATKISKQENSPDLQKKEDHKTRKSGLKSRIFNPPETSDGSTKLENLFNQSPVKNSKIAKDEKEISNHCAAEAEGNSEQRTTTKSVEALKAKEASDSASNASDLPKASTSATAIAHRGCGTSSPTTTQNYAIRTSPLAKNLADSCLVPPSDCRKVTAEKIEKPSTPSSGTVILLDEVMQTYRIFFLS